MQNTPTAYTNDDATREALRKVGSGRTLHEIYGLFYGCMAAPNAADPAQYLAMVFDDELAAEAPPEDAEAVQVNLMSLWNFIGRWRPDEEPFYFPEVEYPATVPGLRQRLADDEALINYFITGLNLGGTEEHDFTDDAIDAMHALAEATTLLQREADPKKAVDVKETTALLDDLEDFIADSIARVASGLKGAAR